MQDMLVGSMGLSAARNYQIPPQTHALFTLNQCFLILGVMRTHENIPEDLHNAVQIVVSSLHACSLPPAGSCDLIPGAPDHPGDLLVDRMDVTRTTEGYLISRVDTSRRDAKWRLLVTNAADLFEITRRRWGPGKIGIANELFKRGIPFRTMSSSCVVRATSYRPLLPIAHIHGYHHTTADYLLYETQRDDFLRSRRGRAAVMKGGIVWRLAVEVLGIEAVLLGPATEIDVGFNIDVDGVTLVDDELTENEMDFICGTAYVRAGE